MTETPSFFHVLISFGAFQAVFLASIFLGQHNRSLAKTFFSLFLLIEGVTLIERLIFETGLAEHFPHLLGISLPINFLKPPILLFMARAITDSKFRLRRIHWFHAIPFVLMLIINLPFYGMSGAEKLQLVTNFSNNQPGYGEFQFYFNLSFFFNIGAYLIVAIRRLKQYRDHISGDPLANWYSKTLTYYSIALGLGMLYYVMRPSGLIEIPYFSIISMLSMSFLIQSIAYRFFIQSSALNTKKPPIRGNMEDWARDQQLVLQKLEGEKMYLSDSLDLASFASSLDLPKKYVSELINLKFAKTFKGLINEYRVEEAKRIMAEGGERLQLLDVGLESGFNNKVSFYRVFKQVTGLSPSDYLAQQRSDHSQKKPTS